MPILSGTESIYLDVFFEPGTLIDIDAMLVGAGGVCKGYYFHTLSLNLLYSKPISLLS